MVPVWSPAAATMSNAGSTVVPFTATSKTRWPGRLVPLYRFAKYSLTSIGTPVGTVNCQCISPPSPGAPGSQRSLSKMPRGVDAGTVESTLATGDQVAKLLPALRYGLGSAWSPAQSGPASTACRVGPPALTRYRTLVAAVLGRLPARKTRPGSDETATDGRVSPPASGKNASRPR